MKAIMLGVLALGLPLIWTASAGADLRTAAAPAAIECRLQKPPGDPRWWSFRLDVDGERRQRCWYPGKPGKPKQELHWGRRPGVERRPEPAAMLPAPVAESRGANRDNDPADQCCWPPLEPEPAPPPRPPAGPTFGQRWNDILNDMAEPVTRWRGQLKDQHRFGE